MLGVDMVRGSRRSCGPAHYEDDRARHLVGKRGWSSFPHGEAARERRLEARSMLRPQCPPRHRRSGARLRRMGRLALPVRIETQFSLQPRQQLLPLGASHSCPCAQHHFEASSSY